MPEAAPLTPLIEQYEGVKSQYPGHLVLFRVGDFYETFGDDAKLLSRELEVVLTARGADAKGERLPMAGVPHHAVETYLGRLVRKGYKVALCDQVEDARLAKGLVRREVTRVVTPGTVVEDRILGSPDHNFLVSVGVTSSGEGRWAAVDVSTGEWFQGAPDTADEAGFVTALAPFAPREVLMVASMANTLRAALRSALLHEFPGVRVEELDGQTGIVDPSGDPFPIVAEDDAGRAMLAYIRATQPRLVPYLERVESGPTVRRMRMDAKTLRHLEISRPMNPDDVEGPTLIGLWDETRTAAGRRTLSFWLKNPLADVDRIRARHDAVATLIRRPSELEAIRRSLGRVADLGRIGARLAGRRLGPRDLEALAASLSAAEEARGTLDRPDSELLATVHDRLAPVPGLREELAGALPTEADSSSDAPRRFRSGYSPELDRLVEEERQGIAELGRLEKEEQQRTGIRTLHVGYNQVFGYYLEVSRSNVGRVPPEYHRKQTLAQGERFTTDRLTEVEHRILGARESLLDREAKQWEEFLSRVERHIPELHRLARAIGELDALTSLAHTALERGHIRPEVDDGAELQLRGARHPVLDRLLVGRFVPNDTTLDADANRVLVLTGPNMSGKSTYMRQVGLLVVLAQAGAFVPAKHARIGVVSSLHTRMGFTDAIGRGKSSFMVEMTEVAEILRDADARSLVLLDEVGRGTSTFDGLALAWATLHYLARRVRCRTLLATHYHQLTELIASLDGAANAHMAVREDKGEVVFLHRLVPGSTDRSYGIHVARLAGLPPELVADAEKLLNRLEREGIALAPGTRAPTRYTQAVLLAGEAPSETEAALRAVDPERLTPLEALAWIVRERARLVEGNPPESPR